MKARAERMAGEARRIAPRSIVVGRLRRGGLVGRLVHSCEIDGRQLLGRNVQSLDEMTAVAREGVALGHVGTRVRAYLDDVLPALPTAALVSDAALGRHHTVRDGCAAALRVGIVDHKLP